MASRWTNGVQCLRLLPANTNRNRNRNSSQPREPGTTLTAEGAAAAQTDKADADVAVRSTVRTATTAGSKTIEEDAMAVATDIANDRQYATVLFLRRVAAGL